MFLCNLISVREWQGREVDLKILNRTMPELGRSNLLKPWPYHWCPRVIKTHRPHHFLFSRVPAVLIVRDPRDVMVSGFHYVSGKVLTTDAGSFSEFIRHPKYGVKAWCDYHSRWRNKARFVIRYEELKKDDIDAFSRLSKALGINAREDEIERAIKMSRLQNLQKVEERERKAASLEKLTEYRFFRKGGTGEWRKYFTLKDATFFNAVLRKRGFEEYVVENLSESV
jgi:hypothetical protein